MKSVKHEFCTNQIFYEKAGDNFWIYYVRQEEYSTEYLENIYGWGQDGWILAEFFVCVFMDRDEAEVHKRAKKKKERGQYPAILTSHLVNKGFIIWLLGKFFSRDTAGSPERAR